MPISNYPSGFANGVSIRGIPLLSLYPGSTWWVDSVNGSNGNKGTFDKPFASFEYATGRAAAGDIIIAKAGHVETIGSAGAWTCDTAGVCYVFLGQGSNKAYCNYTATAATLLVTSANVTFVNPRFVAGIDAVVNAVVVQAADFAMYNAEDFDAAAKAITIGVLTTNAAHRLCIDGYRYHASTTGTQKTERIKTVGALDHIQLYNLDIAGDFSNAPVNLANAACTNVDLKNWNLNNTNSGPQHGLDIHANTTGWAEDVKLRVASGTAYYSSAAKLQWGPDCIGYNTDGSGGAALGTATDIEAKVDSVGVTASTACSQADSAALIASTAVSRITSTGTGVSAVLANIASTQTSVASQTASVGAGTSICNANILSTAASVASTTSSVGTGTSVTNANVLSVAVQTSQISAAVSTAASVGGANAASIASVGTQASVIDANVKSVALQTSVISTATSTAASVGGANAASIASVGVQTSAAAANILSIATQTSQISTAVSTTNSVGAANAASITSVGTSVGAGVQSVATSVGLGVSTTVNYSNQTISILNSLALIISAINSKTV